MKKMIMKALSLMLICLAANAGIAHHSAIAEYDPSNPVQIEGVLTRVEWKNPHIWFYLDVTNADGSVSNWGFSGAPPGLLFRRGISRESLTLGEIIKVEGFRARDGSTNASGGQVTFADGRQVFTASPEDRELEP